LQLHICTFSKSKNVQFANVRLPNPDPDTKKCHLNQLEIQTFCIFFRVYLGLKTTQPELTGNSFAKTDHKAKKLKISFQGDAIEQGWEIALMNIWTSGSRTFVWSLFFSLFKRVIVRSLFLLLLITLFVALDHSFCCSWSLFLLLYSKELLCNRSF